MRAGRTKLSTQQLPDTIDPRLVTRRGGAAYLSVSVCYFDALRAQGLVRPVAFPAARGNGSLRTPLFDVRDLDLLIEKFKVGGDGR